VQMWRPARRSSSGRGRRGRTIVCQEALATTRSRRPGAKAFELVQQGAFAIALRGTWASAQHGNSAEVDPSKQTPRRVAKPFSPQSWTRALMRAR
jgi:hypothetical protein